MHFVRIGKIVCCLALFIGMPSGLRLEGQTSNSRTKGFPLWSFDEINGTCRAKGRLQDREYCVSKLMDQIVAGGKSSIPILISQLTESQPAGRPIYDYWSVTTSGDIAHFILMDLFTDSDWKTFNLPGLESLQGKCNEPAESCWRDLLKKHGRKFVQEKWLAAWDRYKDRVYWDENARCFRVSAKELPGNRCFSYEPSIVHLNGTLVRKSFPGPPNYKDVYRGDRPEVDWLLNLSEPVCVDQDNAQPDLNPAHKDIRELQLVIPAEFYTRYKFLVGQRVSVSGTLFGEHTIHHRTPVLIMVKSLAKADQAGR